MAVIRLLWIAWVGCLVVLPVETSAQGLTGALVGTANAPGGGVVRGAFVRVTPPSRRGA